MSNRFKWIFVLVAGWVLGWYSNQYRAVQQVQRVDRPGTDVIATQREHGVHAGNGEPEKRLPQSESLPPGSQFSARLGAHAYRQALQLMYGQESSIVQERYRAELIRHLESLLDEKQYGQADQLLSIYLEREYRDVEVLLLRARLHSLQGDDRAAIDDLYEAKAYAYRVAEIERIEARIRTLVGEHHRKLRGADALQQRLALYQHLTRLEPDYSPYFIELASAQLALEQLDEARQSLFLVAADPRVADRAQQLLARIDSTVTLSQAAPASIPLNRQGEHFIVEAWINNAVPVRLLIDTGASMTVIRNDVLSAAGVSEPEQAAIRQFNTANGPVQGKVYRLQALSIADQTVENMQIAGLDLAELHGVDGLLGMNYLKHFRFFIDQGRQELRLSAPL